MCETLNIQTKSGPVQGTKKSSDCGYDYYSFQRIPYAKPPVGQLRFKDPEPIDDWTEIIDATNQGPPCYGTNMLDNSVQGDEDSLHINVFTKSVNPSKPLPVMVWIHGGAFMTGSSGTELYGPDFLLQKEIVLISFNYRLGAFGFLSLQDPSLEIPGNAGLKDQNLALKWIRKNCSSFGGDSNNITLFGESAGANSVILHMVSEMSSGLFQKAIAMSPAMINWSLVPPRNWAERLAKSVGWNGEGGEYEILEFLRTVSPEQIVEAQEKLITDEENKKSIIWPFGPVIETYQGSNCFIPKNPKEMLRSAWSSSIPLMIGGTSDEGLLFYRDIAKDPMMMEKLSFQDLVPFELDLSITSEKCLRFSEKLKHFYFGSENPSVKTFKNYLDFMSDKIFWHGIHRIILSRLNRSKNGGPTYLYRFNFDSPFFNLCRIMFCGQDVRGTCHADDVSYLFSNFLKIKLEAKSEEYKTVQFMIETWTKFAESGNPNSEIISPVNWEPLLKDEFPVRCLNISNELRVIDLPETNRMAFWDSFYETDDELF